MEGTEARSILRSAFFEATRQTGISVKHLRAISMLIGGLLGGGLLLSYVVLPGFRSARYGWLILGALCVVVAVTARLAARRAVWWVYRKEIRLAMQRLGFELCVDCGYWLKGLPEGELLCPECGAERRGLGARGAGPKAGTKRWRERP